MYTTKPNELAAGVGPLLSLLLLLPRALKDVQICPSVRPNGPTQRDTSWVRSAPLKTTTLMSGWVFVHVEKKERVEEDPN